MNEPFDTLLHRGGATIELDYKLSGRESELPFHDYSLVLDALEKTNLDYLPTALSMRPVMQKQTGKEYRKVDKELKRDWREAIARARAVEVFPIESLNPENSRLVMRFLIDLTQQALSNTPAFPSRNHPYKRYVA